MPLPLIVMPLIWSVVAGGTATIVKGTADLYRSKKIVESAEQKYERARGEVELKKEKILKLVNEYANHLKSVYYDTIIPFRELLEKMEKMGKMKKIKLPDGVEMHLGSLKKYEKEIFKPAEVFTSAIKAISAGGAAGASAVGLVSLFGAASTGTAISSLSGAAATNATLAWFGGGSLATGGLGMAGGTIVLGGIIAAPALLVTGFILASKGEQALTEAKKFESKVDIECKKLEEIQKYMDKIIERINELYSLATELSKRANLMISRLNSKIDKMEFTPSFIKQFQQALLFVKALADLMRTPILNEKGKLTVGSKQLIVRYKPLCQ